jgi:hypothetical protein
MYIKSSMYGPAQEEDGKVVDPRFLQQQTPGYQNPWRGDLEHNGDPEKGLLHNKRSKGPPYGRSRYVSPYSVWPELC